ncbi:MAG TPA: hypothetical protein VFA80_11060, partial [Xanthobacteraceae bacterium]|nr:hypothetical protein [Xanthobacteraceae bacterium]
NIDPAVTQFAARVEVAADADLAQFYPQHWPAEVHVTAGSEVIKQRVVEAPGDPEQPLDAAGVGEKAQRVLGPLVGRDRASEWFKLGSAAVDDAAACRKLAGHFAAGL